MQQPTRSMADRRIPIWLSGADCTGDEDALTDCPGVGFGNQTRACGRLDIVAIVCFNGPEPGAPPSVPPTWRSSRVIVVRAYRCSRFCVRGCSVVLPNWCHPNFVAVELEQYIMMMPRQVVTCLGVMVQ